MKRQLEAAASVPVYGAVLSGFTMIGSGAVPGAPCINQYSFRECWFDDGFYSPKSLRSIALVNRERRQADSKSVAWGRYHPDPIGQALREESSAAFVHWSAKTLTDKLMPSLAHWQAEDRSAWAGGRLDVIGVAAAPAAAGRGGGQ